MKCWFKPINHSKFSLPYTNHLFMKVGKDKASKNTQILLGGGKPLLNTRSQLQGRTKTFSLSLAAPPKGCIQIQTWLLSTAFSKSPTASSRQEGKMSHFKCFKAIRPPWTLITGLLFAICPSTKDIKMSACRIHSI